MKMAEERNDVMGQYQAIANKLKKKRILKKPNVTEASQQFENLAVTCEREELPQYAGLSYEAAARCQNSLGNATEEGFLLLKSSQQFISNHLRWMPSKMVSTDEHLHYSVICFKECLERLNANSESSIPSNKALTGGIKLQMADMLKSDLSQVDAALMEYEKALGSFPESSLEKIYCQKRLASCKIQLGDYDAALKLVNNIIGEIQNFPMSGLKEEILLDSEITRILILLILQPTPQQITPSAAQVLEKYAWIETVATSESLVMACQCSDGESLIPLEDDLVPYLTNDQKGLLRTLLKQVLKRSKYH